LSVETDTEEMAQYREEERAGSGHVLVGYGTEPTPAVGRRRRPRRATVTSPVPGTPAPTTPGPAPQVVSPLVRRLARDHGVDVRALRGTGAGGVITREDVEQAAGPAARPSTPVAAVQPSTPEVAAQPST